MTIGTRLTLLLSLALLAVLLVFGALSERQNRALDRQELMREGRAIARVAQLSMEDYLRDHQLDDARELVDLITGYERVLGFRIFGKDGTLIYQSTLPQQAPPIDRAELGRVLATRKATESQTFSGAEPLASYIYPLSHSNGEPLGALQVMVLESFEDEMARSGHRSLLILTIATILATACVLLVLVRLTVGRPIEELARSFRDVGSGDLTARVPVRRRDEIGLLAGGFNAMCERLEHSQRALVEAQEEQRRAEESLRRAERLASVGRLAAGLAHEIGTPLNVIGGRAEALLAKLEDNEVARRNLSIIVAQIDRISRIVRGMLDFARAPEPRRVPTSLPGVVARVLELLEMQIDTRDIRVETELPPDLPPVTADADQLHQVFLNLAKNAVDAMPGGGTLKIRADAPARPPASVDLDGTSFVAVAFEDTGAGIASKDLGHIFDPFFSTKDVGEGTGLGLSVSYGIVREHGGAIDVSSELDRGTRVTVYLPLSDRRATPAELR